MLTQGCGPEGVPSPCLATDQSGEISAECAHSILEENEWTGLAETTGAVVHHWPHLLKTNDRLESGIGKVDPSITLSEPAWFYFIDLYPGALWNHPTIWIRVNSRTREVVADFRESYPVLNGVHLFSESKAPTLATSRQALTFPAPSPIDAPVPADDDPRFAAVERWRGETDRMYLRRVKGMFEGQQSEAQMNGELAKCVVPVCEGTPKKLALVIEGGRLRERESIKSIVGFLRAQGFETRHLDSGHAETADRDAADQLTTLPNIARAFEWLAASVGGCCDEVVVVINAHGASDGEMEMNPRITLPDSVIGHAEGGMLTHAALKGYLNKIRSCRTKIYIDSCYSGSHLELGLNVIPENYSGGCMCRTVAVSSSARQPSWSGSVSNFALNLVNTNGDFSEAWRLYRQSYTDDDLGGEKHRSPRVQATDCLLCEDRDEDGLIGGAETETNYSDPGKRDTDEDGLFDGAEKRFGSDPRKRDTDGDGLSDFDEFERGTRPDNRDTDADGLSDRNELFLELDPLDPDTDDDGSKDGADRAPLDPEIF